jgi:hypothetical protein
MHKTLFIVWKKYQRRAEVLEPPLKSKVSFIPHIFRRKSLRLIDYFYKPLIDCYVGLKTRPGLIVFQAPPLYNAFNALVLEIPYVIDAHNPVFQNFGGKISWKKLPLSGFLIRNARAVIVHNHGILKLARKSYPDVTLFNIPDLFEAILGFPVERFSLGVDRISGSFGVEYQKYKKVHVV